MDALRVPPDSGAGLQDGVEMQVAAATASVLDDSYAVVAECRLALAAQGIFQWDEQYPGYAFFKKAIAAGTLFALSDRGRIRGVAVLNESEAPEWRAVAWEDVAGHPLAIHALAIAPSVQGRGYGRTLLTFCEQFAIDSRHTSIRLDAFSENRVALSLYERHGYQQRGSVRFASKPLGHQRYCCYEKLLGQRVPT